MLYECDYAQERDGTGYRFAPPLRVCGRCGSAAVPNTGMSAMLYCKATGSAQVHYVRWDDVRLRCV